MNKLFYYSPNSRTISLFSFSQLHTQYESLLTLNNNKKEKEIKSQSSLCNRDSEKERNREIRHIK